MADADVPASRTHPQATTQGLAGVMGGAKEDPAYGAFMLLRVGLAALPL